MQEYHKFKSLVLLQLKDKVDSSFKAKTNLLRLIIFILIKFIVVASVTYAFLFFCRFLGIFYYSESTTIMVIIMFISLILSLISCTNDLMKNLYLQEDNKVLITLPVRSNIIFISKLTVFYLYEIKKNLGFLIPITFGSLLFLVMNNCAMPITMFWMWVPILFITLIPVLAGAILSIPAMYVYNFLKRYSVIQIIITFILVSLVTLIIVKLISLIPTDINLIRDWPKVRVAIGDFLRGIDESLFLTRGLIRSITGEQPTSTAICVIKGFTFIRLLIIIGVDVLLLVLVYFISRPIFFKMMAKSTENKRSNAIKHRNRKIDKYITFVNKELKLNLRTMSISINYLIIYVVVPILILLLNALYKVMDTKYLGTILKYVFNILMITLPMLASNALVATYYSSEGRAGYMKKVKPIDALIPLFSKLAFNMLFSIPSLFISTAIFGSSVGFNLTLILFMGLALMFLHFGHMVYSATLDISNPQNEQYATIGVNFNNPNEAKSTTIAFILSIIYTLFSYKILYESGMEGNFLYGIIKLLIISIALFTYFLIQFIRRVRAFYYD